VGIVALGKCGARFGVQGSMHWPSKMRICKERKGGGLSCDGGSEPCSMGLLLAQAPASASSLPLLRPCPSPSSDSTMSRMRDRMSII